MTRSISLGDALAYHARRDANRAVLTHGHETISRAELDARANRRARLLATQGVIQGDFVVISLPNGVEFFETVFALWKLGAVPCPVSSKLPDPELRAIIDLATPRLVIGAVPDRLPGFAGLPAGTVPGDSCSAEPFESRISPYWKAVTSGGSTGRPKIIVADVPGTVDPDVGAGLIRFEETVLNPGPLYHNAPFKASTQAMFAGGHVVNMDRFDPVQTLALIESHRVGYVVLVPTMMSRIWHLPPEQRDTYDLSSLNVIVHMAAPCAAWLKENWLAWIGPDRLFEVYGTTEGTGSTGISGRDWLTHRGSVGKVMPGSELSVVDEDGTPCLPGDVGEIFFRPLVPGKEFHYIGAQPICRDGWVFTGDLGYLDNEGYLHLADRRTDMIISGGVNIYPAEIEAAIDQFPDVLASAVIGLPDMDLGKRVHAIVQVKPGASIDLKMMSSFLSSQLARNKIPRSMELTTNRIHNEAGKVNRSDLTKKRLEPESDLDSGK